MKLSRFKDIPGFEGLYRVSPLGEVLSIINGKEKILKHALLPTGYHFVSLRKDGKTIRKYVHRLVLITFVGDQPNLLCNHINGDKGNNNLSNLEWATYSENANHAYATGLKYSLSRDIKRKIYSEYKETGISHRELVKKYSISKTHIGRIVRGEV